MNRIAQELPFSLQANMNTGVKLLEDMDVLSIAEWNKHHIYSKYPIILVNAFRCRLIGLANAISVRLRYQKRQLIAFASIIR